LNSYLQKPGQFSKKNFERLAAKMGKAEEDVQLMIFVYIYVGVTRLNAANDFKKYVFDSQVKEFVKKNYTYSF